VYITKQIKLRVTSSICRAIKFRLKEDRKLVCYYPY